MTTPQTPLTPPTPEELWEELVCEAGEEEIQAAASVGVEEAEAYLAEHGFDVAAERAKAEAFLAELGGRGAPAQTTATAKTGQTAEKSGPRARPAERRSRPAAVWLAAAATVAVGGAAAAYVALHDQKRAPDRALPEPTAPVPNPTTPPDIAIADSLRHRAAAAMAGGQPDEALRLLDEARDKDPEGDTAPDVVQLRKRADEALKPHPK